MSFLIQHGWGKGSGANDKIKRALDERIASGVIFGPDAETPNRLENYIRALRADYPRAEVLIDPQVYVATIDGANYKHLVDYQDRYFEVNLRPTSFRPRFIQHLVKRTIDWQISNNVSGLICPGVRIQGFASAWAQIAVSLIQESLDYKSTLDVELPVYATLAVSAESFTDPEMVNEFLDALTVLEVDGFYVIIFQAGSEYRRAVDVNVLPSIMWLLYSLGEVNRFRVIVGYADLNSYLYRTVGASDFASGWSHNLRRLTEDRWSSTGGGRRPSPRYTSLQLMNSILVDPELRRVFEERQPRKVISNSPFDSVFSGATFPSRALWTEFLSHMHYLFVCSKIENLVPTSDLREKCRRARARILQASRVYIDLEDNHNIEFSPYSSSRHLGVWEVALQEFCAQAGISL